MSSRKQEKERLRQERLEARATRQSSEQRKRLILGYVVAGILGVAVIGGRDLRDRLGRQPAARAAEASDDQRRTSTAEFGFLPDGPADRRARGDAAARCRQRRPRRRRQRGRMRPSARPRGRGQHATSTTTTRSVDYKTNPPTSGDHFAATARRSRQRRAGRRRLPRDAAREPDGPLARARPDRDPVQPRSPRGGPARAQGRLRRVPPGVILLFPNAEMPYDVAVTAWTQLVGCDGFEGGATLDVLRAFRDQFLGQRPRAGRLRPRSSSADGRTAPGGARETSPADPCCNDS